jgi:hypothetical protein
MGRTVVVILSVELPGPSNETGLVVKLHADAGGVPEHDSEMPVA